METWNVDVETLVATYGDLALAYALDLLAALLLLVGGWIVAGWMKRLLVRELGKLRRVDPMLVSFLANIARYLVLVVVLIAVLAQFGVQTASILAVLGTAGLAVGLALQGTLSNVAAGMMLLFLRPFRSGDYIDAGGLGGTVIDVGLFNTELKTADGIYVIVPNSQITSGAITNYSHHDTRRLDLAVGVAYDDDIDRGLEVLRGLMESDERVLKDPAPQVMVMELGDSAVTLNMRCWAKTGDFWDLRWDMTKRMKAAVEAAGLSIPFPQRDLHLFQSGGEEGKPAVAGVKPIG